MYMSYTALAGYWVWGSDGSCTVADETVNNVRINGLAETAPTGVSADRQVLSLAVTASLEVCAPC